LGQPSIYVWGPARLVQIDREIAALREKSTSLQREYDAIGNVLNELPVPASEEVRPTTIQQVILSLMNDHSVGWRTGDLVSAAEQRYFRTMNPKSVRVYLGRLSQQGKIEQKGKLWYAVPGMRTTRPVRFHKVTKRKP
jgi:hypothetical protein